MAMHEYASAKLPFAWHGAVRFGCSTVENWNPVVHWNQHCVPLATNPEQFVAAPFRMVGTVHVGSATGNTATVALPNEVVQFTVCSVPAPIWSPPAVLELAVLQLVPATCRQTPVHRRPVAFAGRPQSARAYLKGMARMTDTPVPLPIAVPLANSSEYVLTLEPSTAASTGFTVLTDQSTT
eukprot:724272_1